MEQFSLDKWLQDKSQKVATREGRPVRIVCWDRKATYWKIIGLVPSPDGYTENPFYYDVNGNEADSRLHGNRHNLFFEDNEDKEQLTEFEKMLRYVLECYSGYEFASESEIETLKLNAKSLLNLARKELFGDLPKWKKAEETICLPDGAVKIDEDGKIICMDAVCEGEYFIMLQSLKSLQKEE